MANTGVDWFVGNAAFFVKVGKTKVVCPLSFVYFVIGGKEMLLYLVGYREQSQDLLLFL